MWITAIVATLVLVGGFLVAYYFIRGYPAGSRVVVPSVQKDIPTDAIPFTLYYAPWCPYSKTALENWKTLQTMLDTQPVTYGGHHIKLQSIDCDATKSKCQAAGIDAYPSYKLELPTKVIDYNGPPNTTVWDTFLQDALGTKVVEV